DPHDHNVPSDLTAKLCKFPADTDTQSLSVPTCVGTNVTPDDEPNPVRPASFQPHDHNVPSDLTATPCPTPADTDTQAHTSSPPAPPVPFQPHAHNVPSDLPATPCRSPADTDTQSRSVPTCVGTNVSPDADPTPATPCPSDPHDHNVPSDPNATLNPSPAST